MRALEKLLGGGVINSNKPELERFMKRELELLVELRARVVKREGYWGSDASATAAMVQLYTEIAQALTGAVDVLTGAPFDPYLKAKLESLTKAKRFVEEVCTRVPDLLTNQDDDDGGVMDASILKTMLLLSLFGGLDEPLALSPLVDGKVSIRDKREAFRLALEEKESGHLVAEEVDMANLIRLLLDGAKERRQKSKINASTESTESSAKVEEIAICLDVVGHQLVGDLLLAHVLVSLGCCDVISFHTRKTPAGLAATTVDVVGHIEHLADPKKGDDVWAVRHVGETLRQHAAAGRFRFEEDDACWSASHEPLWNAQEGVIQHKFANKKLVIFKGDVNYRRLFGPCEWPVGTTTKSVLGTYWPSSTPCVALRICKRPEFVVGGLDDAAQKRASKIDSSWLERGEFGLLQFIDIEVSGKAQ